MTSSEIRVQIRTFIEKMYGRGKKFSDDADLFQLGIVDSLGVRELLPFLEDTFAVQIADSLFFDERFASVNGLTAIIDELRAHA